VNFSGVNYWRVTPPLSYLETEPLSVERIEELVTNALEEWHYMPCRKVDQR